MHSDNLVQYSGEALEHMNKMSKDLGHNNSNQKSKGVGKNKTGFLCQVQHGTLVRQHLFTEECNSIKSRTEIRMEQRKPKRKIL